MSIIDFSNVNYFCPDLVRCSYCESEMYVDCGVSSCPVCGKDGCLMDIEENELNS